MLVCTFRLYSARTVLRRATQSGSRPKPHTPADGEGVRDVPPKHVTQAQRLFRVEDTRNIANPGKSLLPFFFSLKADEIPIYMTGALPAPGRKGHSHHRGRDAETKGTLPASRLLERSSPCSGLCAVASSLTLLTRASECHRSVRASSRAKAPLSRRACR